jgi:hypothetical protein
MEPFAEMTSNTIADTAQIPTVLAKHGVAAKVARSFGSERLPDGLVAIIAMKNSG